MPTPEGLPVVTVDQVISMSEDLRRQPALADELFDHVYRTNQAVAFYIKTSVEFSPPEVQEYVLRVALGLYEMLRRQAEADRLKELTQ